ELRRKLASAPAATPIPAPAAAPPAPPPRPLPAPTQTAPVVSLKPRHKSKATSTAAIAGLVVACAAALGIIAAGVAWWTLNGRPASGPIATAPPGASVESSVPG